MNTLNSFYRKKSQFHYSLNVRAKNRCKILAILQVCEMLSMIINSIIQIVHGFYGVSMFFKLSNNKK